MADPGWEGEMVDLVTHRILSCFESLSTNGLLSGHPEEPAYGVSKGAIA